MSRPTAFAICLAVVALTATGPAFAYIGPGAGITMLGALWGVIIAIALALGAVLLWPIRALIRRRRKPAPGTAPAAVGGDPAATAAAPERTTMTAAPDEAR